MVVGMTYTHTLYQHTLYTRKHFTQIYYTNSTYTLYQRYMYIMHTGLALAAATARVVELGKDGGQAAKQQLKSWGIVFMVCCTICVCIANIMCKLYAKYTTPSCLSILTQARAAEAVQDARHNLQYMATSVARAHAAPRRPEDVPMEQRQAGAQCSRDEPPSSKRGAANTSRSMWKRKE